MLNLWLPAVLAMVPPAVFCLICYYGSDDMKHGFVKIMNWFYVFVMIAFLIVQLVAMIEPCGLCSIVNQIFIFVVGLHLLAAVLNITEFFDLVSGIAYWAFMPTMLIMLQIYSFFGLNNTSWGTRETSAQTSLDKKTQNFALCTCKLGSLFKCKFCFLPKTLVSDLTDEQIEAVNKKEKAEKEAKEKAAWVQLTETSKRDNVGGLGHSMRTIVRDLGY